MKTLDNITPHPAHIVRGILLRPVREEPGHWQAVYEGDEWLSSFITPPAPKAAILRAFESRDIRRGLPLVITDITAPRRGEWRDGELVA